ncbi:hypothetical protein HDV00_008428 [Rhizophlyctis rosea]|nr:hypothetical protein HDV00_008428 [Rhizophlyctis rosea]
MTDTISEVVDDSSQHRLTEYDELSDEAADAQELEDLAAMSEESFHDMESLKFQQLSMSRSPTYQFQLRSSDASDQEYDDEHLFPGWRFGRPVASEEAKKEGFGYLSNEFGIPKQLRQLDLSEGAKEVYEHNVLQKYFKNGMLSTFKGREEMVISEAKVVAHKEIERLHAETHQTEKKLLRLEEELSRARINQIVQETQNWEIDKKLPGGERARRQHRALAAGAEEPEFSLPNDPVLLLNRQYRKLHDEYLEYQTMAGKASELIPRLEAAVIPIQHELSALQIQRDRLRGLETELVEEESKEFNEMQIVFKYRGRQAHNKALAARRHAAMAAEAERCRQEEERIKAEKMEAHLQVKRRHLKARLRERLKMERAEKEKKEAKEAEVQQRKQRAVSELEDRVMRIRQDIEQHHVLEDELPIGSNESLAISETKGKIYRKTMRDLQRRHAAMRDQEARRMQILHRLLQEDARRKAEDEKSLLERQHQGPAIRKSPTHSLEEWVGQSLDEESKVNTGHSVVSELAVYRPKTENVVDVSEEETDEDRALSQYRTAPSDRALPARIPLPPPRHKVQPAPQSHALLTSQTPFLAHPSAVIFKDYDPGRTYERTMTLTNVSCRVNAFKLLPLAVNLAEFFEVQFSPLGRMSAGKTCELKVIFRPPPGYDHDILDGSLHLEAEYGGKFSVPIGCASKKCMPTISAVGGLGAMTVRIEASELEQGGGASWSDEELDSDVETSHVKGRRQTVAKVLGPRTVLVDFDTCMVGARVFRTVHVQNDGSLSTGLEVNPQTQGAGNAPPASRSLDEEVNPFAVMATDTTSENTSLKGYASHTITFVFAPPYEVTRKHLTSAGRRLTGLSVRQYTQRFTIKFDRPGVQPITVVCRAGSTEAPLTINKEVMDFKLCIAGNLYRDRIILRNKHSTALKFWVDIGVGVSQGVDVRPASTGDVEGGAPEGLAGDNNEGAVGGKQPTGEEAKERNWSQTYPVDIADITTEASKGRTDSMILNVRSIGEIEISPRLAFVQPYEPFSVWFKVRPSRTAQALIGTKRFSLPLIIKYISNDVECPIPLTLVGAITIKDIKLSGADGEEALDFKRCSIFESKSLLLRITNQSQLAQTVRLASSHKALCIDSSAFELHPCQTVVREVQFEPVEEGHLEMQLVCESTLDTKSIIACHGVGIRPLLKFDSNLIDLGAVAYGTEKSARVHLGSAAVVGGRNSRGTNGLGGQRGVEVEYTFGNVTLVNVKETGPKKATLESEVDYLRVWPGNGVLREGDSVSIEVTLVAPMPTSAGSEVAPKAARTSSVAAADTPEGQSRPVMTRQNSLVPKSRSRAPTAGSSPALPQVGSEGTVGAVQATSDPVISNIDWTSVEPRQMQFLIPCRMCRGVSELNRLSALTEGTIATDLRSAEDGERTIHLLARALLVPPDFIIETKTVDFGKVPVGERTLKTITVQNLSDRPITLHSNGLSPLGPFGLSKALREIAPHSVSSIKLFFEPKAETTLVTLFTISARATQTRLQLLGQGVVPRVVVETGEMYMGDICVGENSTKSFVIRNQSPFPVRYRISLSEAPGDHHGTMNWSGVNAFSVASWEGSIQANVPADVVVKFAPDRESDNYFDFVKVHVWGLEEPLVVPVSGRAWDTTTTFFNYDKPPATLITSPAAFPPKFELEYLQELLGGEGELGEFLASLEGGGVEGKPAANSLEDLLHRTTRTDFRFVTHTCPWKQTANGWTIDAKDLSIGNLKPVNVKIEGKKSPTAEFTIEPFTASFVFDETLKRYRLTPSPPQTVDSYKFAIEPTKGTVDLGATKSLKITLINPIADFWTNMGKATEVVGRASFGVKRTPPVEAAVGAGRSRKPETPARGPWGGAGGGVDEVKLAPLPMERRQQPTKPGFVETCFKVTMRGGFRVVDPVGVPGQGESRIWIVKVQTAPLQL